MAPATTENIIIASPKEITILVEGGITGPYEIKYISTQLRDYTLKKVIKTFRMNNGID